MSKSSLYANPYGIWTVTTEGDVEGKSIRHLGSYEGYIDDIALALADQCYYSLRFTATAPLPTHPTKSSVSVSLDIDSGTWDMKPFELANWARRIMTGRPVEITPGTSYASFTISVPQEKKAETEKNIARQKALAKLSREDKKALGLEE